MLFLGPSVQFVRDIHETYRTRKWSGKILLTRVCILRRMELAQEATQVDPNINEQLRELGIDSIVQWNSKSILTLLLRFNSRTS